MIMRRINRCLLACLVGAMVGTAWSRPRGHGLAYLSSHPLHRSSGAVRSQRTTSIFPSGSSPSSSSHSLISQLGARSQRTRRAAAMEGISALMEKATMIAQSAGSSPQVSGLFNNISSLLVLSLVIAIHELGHFLAARWQGIKVKNFSIGFGPALVKYTDKKDDIEYTVRAVPAGGFVAFPRHYEVTDEGEYIMDEDADLLQNRPPWQQAIVVSSGIIANMLLSYSLLFATISTAGLPRPEFSPGPMVVRVTDQASPAAAAGLSPNDIILNINGKAMKGDDKGLVEAVNTIATSGGKPLSMEVSREGKIITKTVIPKTDAKGKSSIGILMASHIEKVNLLKPKSTMEAVSFVNKEFGSLVKETANGLKRFTETRSTEGLTGPLGIVRVGADLAAIDQLALVKFAALISVNLAIVNALPFPGLDGGQMVFVLLEWARGRKLQVQIQEGINAVAFSVLAVMSMYLIFGDIANGPTSLDKLVEQGSGSAELMQNAAKNKP